MSLAELQGLEEAHAIPTYVRNPVQFVRGSGCRLWDDEDNEYLDFLAGISVLNVGHCHPRVVEAIREQAGQLTHVSNLYYTEPGLTLSARLAESSLGGKVFLCNSGAEAIEAAIKLVRRARPQGNVVVLQGAFHGRTYGALSATPPPASSSAPPTRARPPRRSIRTPPPFCSSRSRGRPGSTCSPTSCCKLRARRATGLAPRSCSMRSSAGWGGPGRSGRTSRRVSFPTR